MYSEVWTEAPGTFLGVPRTWKVGCRALRRSLWGCRCCRRSDRAKRPTRGGRGGGLGGPAPDPGPQGQGLPAVSLQQPARSVTVGRARQPSPARPPQAWLSKGAWGPEHSSLEPATLLTPSRALLLLGTSTLAPGTGPDLISIAAQMVHHSLASQNCPLPGVCSRGGRAGGRRHSAASGQTETPLSGPCTSRVCGLGARGDNRLEAN